MLYAATVEGAISAFREMELVTTIVAERTDGEVQQALVTARADQVAKLRGLIHVLELNPAEDGIYVDNLGRWHAIKDGEEVQSGHWLVPTEIARSIDSRQPTTASGANPVVRDADPVAGGERDSVCGMRLKPGQEEANVTYQGQTYHFCSVECRDLFLKEPTHYIKAVGMEQSVTR
ncbi:MAG: YHS domain-containing protein [Chloroflexota bacterium]